MLATILTSLGGTRVPVGEESEKDRSRLLAYLLLVVPTAGLVGYQVYATYAGTPGDLQRSAGWVGAGALAVTVLYAVWWLRSRDATRAAANGAALWFLGTTAVATGSGGLAIAVQRELGGSLAEATFPVALVATAGGAVGALVGVHRAGRQRAIEAVREERDAAERRNRQLTVLNRILRHELRNGLNLIQGNAEIVMDTTPGDRPRLGDIHSGVDELMELSERAREVQSLLSGPSSGEETTTVDVAGAVRDHVERLSGAYPDVEVETSIPASATAECHELVDQAVGEIVENAFEHGTERPTRTDGAGHDGGPTVRVEVSTVDDGDRVEVTVADDGPGIPSHELSVLEEGYDPGLRGSQGLGLQLAAGAIAASDGQLAFEDADPRGTIARVRLDAT